MTLQELLEMVVADRGPIALICVIVLTLIQVTPIKLNPWTAIFRWLGKQLNKDVVDKIGCVEKNLEAVEKRLDEHIAWADKRDLKTRRMAILDFGSSVLRGVNYHREKFEFMIKECDTYEKYCKDNNVKNGVAEASIAEIRRVYQEHLRNADFLVDRSYDT